MDNETDTTYKDLVQNEIQLLQLKKFDFFEKFVAKIVNMCIY